MLSKWGLDEKREFAYYLAKNYPVRQAWQRMCEREGVHQYTYQICTQFAKDKECKDLVREAYDIVREEVKDSSYSHSGSRIDTLIEVAQKLLNAFRASTKPTEMTKLSAELRSTLSDIRQEIDPYGIENQQTRSHFENILMGVQGLPNKQRELILGVTSSEPTSEIVNN